MADTADQLFSLYRGALNDIELKIIEESLRIRIEEDTGRNIEELKELKQMIVKKGALDESDLAFVLEDMAEIPLTIERQARYVGDPCFTGQLSALANDRQLLVHVVLAYSSIRFNVYARVNDGAGQLDHYQMLFYEDAFYFFLRLWKEHVAKHI
jgi:hypothetical protein